MLQQKHLLDVKFSINICFYHFCLSVSNYCLSLILELNKNVFFPFLRLFEKQALEFLLIESAQFLLNWAFIFLKCVLLGLKNKTRTEPVCSQERGQVC